MTFRVFYNISIFYSAQQLHAARHVFNENLASFAPYGEAVCP
jgi:hypothetical protein